MRDAGAPTANLAASRGRDLARLEMQAVGGNGRAGQQGRERAFRLGQVAALRGPQAGKGNAQPLDRPGFENAVSAPAGQVEHGLVGIEDQQFAPARRIAPGIAFDQAIVAPHETVDLAQAVLRQPRRQPAATVDLPVHLAGDRADDLPHPRHLHAGQGDLGRERPGYHGDGRENEENPAHWL